MSEVTKEDLNELKSEITTLKELYEKELQRQNSEREELATENEKLASEKLEAEQAEKEAREIEQAEKAEQEASQAETNEIEKQELSTFRLSVLESLDELSESASDQNKELLESIDLNLTALVEQLDKQETANEIARFSDLTLIFFLLGCVPAYLFYKVLYRIISTAL
ncbi:hypothetical protein [Enterococcus sp. BWR-S5]|uniref:hypothetical protein n=1 Tax=Enterococcus sp. BWR-S5 TaxID=2787714 RepID=UPI0019204372|nr:hypothetical protein [Enterococcus sp. BWR-S5]MBL1224577.1 hypothetical protein [Enterococcus sp. BWR-S5]MBL1224588.1 hypothetical protein [Enterococcus sp. BWR-S5]